MESMDGTEGTERTKGTGEKPYPACANCRHFRRYYLKFGQRYRELDFGHCCRSRRRRRKADATACSDYRMPPDIQPLSPEKGAGLEKDNLAEIIQKARLKT